MVTVEQAERSPAPVFVLGVYGSAVYARWIGPDEQERVQALAVAAEPEPFWRGEGADAIVARVQAPLAAGRLVAAQSRFNGASGRALDELILTPLGLRRNLVWTCDLVPHFCANRSQLDAIARAYTPLAAELGLPPASPPPVPATFADDHRAQTIAADLVKSTASLLILLGDDPIRHFLHYYSRRHERLGDFGRNAQNYGRLHRVEIDGRRIQVLPLAHPRQLAQLGRSTARLYELHQEWLAVAHTIL